MVIVIPEIPIKDKLTLTVPEASALAGIPYKIVNAASERRPRLLLRRQLHRPDTSHRPRRLGGCSAIRLVLKRKKTPEKSGVFLYTLGYRLATLRIENGLIPRKTGHIGQMWKYSSYSSGVGGQASLVGFRPRLRSSQVSIRSS